MCIRDRSNTTTSLAEDTETGTRIAVANITVSDDGLGTNDLSLGGDDAALFEIDGTGLYLTANATLNATDNPSLDVTVNVDDVTVGASPDDSDALAISVTPVNAAPTVALSNTTTSLAEDTETGTRIAVADITVSDDGLGSNTLSLSGDDAALFEIDTGVLYL